MGTIELSEDSQIMEDEVVESRVENRKFPLWLFRLRYV